VTVSLGSVTVSRGSVTVSPGKVIVSRGKVIVEVTGSGTLVVVTLTICVSTFVIVAYDVSVKFTVSVLVIVL
jgi:hypothetical protein